VAFFLQFERIGPGCGFLRLPNSWLRLIGMLFPDCHPVLRRFGVITARSYSKSPLRLEGAHREILFARGDSMEVKLAKSYLSIAIVILSGLLPALGPRSLTGKRLMISICDGRLSTWSGLKRILTVILLQFSLGLAGPSARAQSNASSIEGLQDAHNLSGQLVRAWDKNALSSHHIGTQNYRRKRHLLSRTPPSSGGNAHMHLGDAYGKLPLSFEINNGQSDPHVKFLSRGQGFNLFLTGDAAVFSLAGSKPGPQPIWAPSEMKGVNQGNSNKRQSTINTFLQMKLIGANPEARVRGMDVLLGKANYFIGRDPSIWRTKVPTYAKVKYEDVYPGIDLVYYGNQGQLEYDFVVAPGADPKAIKLALETSSPILGSRNAKADPAMQIAHNGDLVLKTAGGKIRLQKPMIYQLRESRPSLVAGGQLTSTTENKRPDSDNGLRTRIEGQFVLTSHNQLSLIVEGYDHSKPLVIDPTLSYSTYLGGSGGDGAETIQVDSNGNAYVIGTTNSTNFPVSFTAIQKTFGGTGSPCAAQSPCGDAFVTKISADGKTVLYSTYFGGSGEDDGSAIAIDSAGDAYVTGFTASTNFPVTASAFQKSCGGQCYGNAFISKLSPDGSSLIYSTYLGGSDQGHISNFLDLGYGIAVDSSGNAYVTGETISTDFPVTSGSFQTTLPSLNLTGISGFVTKINPSGSALGYSTYLGGSVQEFSRAIAVDGGGNAIVTGQSYSPDFPVTPGSFQFPLGTGGQFVTKLNPTGTGLVFSSVLGTLSYLGLGLDSSGNVYLAGNTTPGSAFPTTPGALDGSSCPRGDNYVIKMSADGTGLLSSAHLCDGFPEGIAPDSFGNIYIAGATDSPAFPATTDAFQKAIGNSCCYSDAILSKLSPDISILIYSSYLGGENSETAHAVAVDPSGNAYITGYTGSTLFPTLNPLQPANGGGSDAFVAKFLPGPLGLSVYPAIVSFSKKGVGISGFPRQVTLANPTNMPIAVTSIVPTGDFSQTNNCGDVLAPGSHCTVNVIFNPSSAIDLIGTLTISDSGAGSPHTVQLSGTGVNGPVVYLPQTNPYFGNEPTGSTSPPFPLTIINVGNADLLISSESLPGPSGFLFGPGNCGLVAPQASCAISMTFKASIQGGVVQAPLNISDNASDSPQGWLLMALGVSPTVTFSSDAMRFRDQPIGTTSAPQSVYLINGESNAITIGSISASGDFHDTNNCPPSLPVGAYCKIDVTFVPSQFKLEKGAITVMDSGAGSPHVLPLFGPGTPAAVTTLSTTNLTFSGQPVGTPSSPLTVTLSNPVITSLNITGISVSGDFTETNTCGSGLGGGASCTITVTFTPTFSGARSGTLTVTDNSTSSPQVITLTGAGIAPVVGVSLTSLTFFNQPVGSTSAAQTVTLSNSGTAALTISGIAISGDFAQTNTCGASVGAGANCTISVTFTPTAAGLRSGILTITDNSNGAATSTQFVGLSGTGSAPAVTLAPSSITFSGQLVNSTSAAQTVTLTNSGTVSVSISGIAASGDFAQTNTCGSSVAAGANCTISVTFTPTAIGVRSGTLTITDSAPGSPQMVALSGTGVQPAVTLSATSQTFGNQNVSSMSSAMSITLTNSGSANLTVSSIVATGDYAQTNNCGSSVAVGANCTIMVTFTPVAPGTRSGTLTITDNAPGSPHVITLSGTGVGTGVTLSLTSLTFSGQQVGTPSSTQTVTLTNSGNAAVNISGIAVGGSNGGDFAQTNTCGTGVAAAANCTISVTFTPTAAGSRGGTLTITDNAPGSPQTIALSGMGTDFAVGTGQGSSAAATVTAGGTANFTLTFSGTAGFNGTVALTCSGAPALATCSITPSSLILNGTTPANATVTVTTTARGMLWPQTRFLPVAPGSHKELPILLLAVTMATLAGFARWNRRGRGRLAPTMALALGLFFVVMLAAIWMPACGGGSTTSSSTVATGTPAGTYTLDVIGTVTSGSTTTAHDFKLTLTVN